MVLVLQNRKKTQLQSTTILEGIAKANCNLAEFALQKLTILQYHSYRILHCEKTTIYFQLISVALSNAKFMPLLHLSAVEI